LIIAGIVLLLLGLLLGVGILYTIGIILIIVGAAVWHFLGSERFIAFIGAVLALIGLVLVLVGALGGADVDLDSAVRVLRT